MVEGVDQHQRPADEVERLIGHAVPGEAAGGDEAVGQQEGGRAEPAGEFDEEINIHQWIVLNDTHLGKPIEPDHG